MARPRAGEEAPCADRMNFMHEAGVGSWRTRFLEGFSRMRFWHDYCNRDHRMIFSHVSRRRILMNRSSRPFGGAVAMAALLAAALSLAPASAFAQSRQDTLVVVTEEGPSTLDIDAADRQCRDPRSLVEHLRPADHPRLASSFPTEAGATITLSSRPNSPKAGSWRRTESR